MSVFLLLRLNDARVPFTRVVVIVNRVIHRTMLAELAALHSFAVVTMMYLVIQRALGPWAPNYLNRTVILN